MIRKIAFCAGMICCGWLQAGYAQVEVELPEPAPVVYDTNYISSYRYRLTTRVYVSQKYTVFTLPTDDGNFMLFRPNNTFNQGVGWTYRGFSINLGFGLPGINGNSSQRGKSSWLDCQMHMYGRRNTIDVFLQRYQGYYIGQGKLPGYEGYYNDEAIKVRTFGGIYTHIHNWKRYSFRFGATQDEFQKRSSGSLLYGMTVLYSLVKKDDEGIAHPGIAGLSRYSEVGRINTWNIGPHIGYGYNWIFLKRWYLGAAVNMAATLSLYQENKGMGSPNPEPGPYLTGTHADIAPSAIGRLAAGYNSDSWGVAFYYVHHTHLNRSYIGQYTSGSVGNYRVNFIYRFAPGKKVKKVLRPYEWFFK